MCIFMHAHDFCNAQNCLLKSMNAVLNVLIIRYINTTTQGALRQHRRVPSAGRQVRVLLMLVIRPTCKSKSKMWLWGLHAALCVIMYCSCEVLQSLMTKAFCLTACMAIFGGAGYQQVPVESKHLAEDQNLV